MIGYIAICYYDNNAGQNQFVWNKNGIVVPIENKMNRGTVRQKRKKKMPNAYVGCDDHHI